jgi:hypothetical protein
MPEISASLVKELRDRTGAGWMECKRALVETKGDLDEAERVIREKGLAAAKKRAGRTTPEGKVLARIENGRGAIVAVGSETEPVSANEEFLGFAERVMDAVEAQGPEAVKELESDRVDLVARIGENVEVVGASRPRAGRSSPRISILPRRRSASSYELWRRPSSHAWWPCTSPSLVRGSSREARFPRTRSRLSGQFSRSCPTSRGSPPKCGRR